MAGKFGVDEAFYPALAVRFPLSIALGGPLRFRVTSASVEEIALIVSEVYQKADVNVTWTVI